MLSFLKSDMAAQVKRVSIPRRGVDYRGKVVLAPMVRAGELPSRLLALRYGADLIWGPETVDRAMIGTSRRFNDKTKTIEWYRLSSHKQKESPLEAKESIIYKMLPEKEAGKLIFQIGTADAERAVQAARLVAGDVAGIDVNAGCPKPFSTSGGMGAALLRTPDKLCSILEALVRTITPEYEIGISVKIRLLETAHETEALVRRLCATGITGLTVHCRTTPMRPREPAIRGQLRMVVEVCREYGVACLMNGDVENRDQGLQLVKEFGADGAMIATAAEKNPSCFRSEAQGGLLPWQDVVGQYLEATIVTANRFANTKYLLGQMVPGKEKVRPLVDQSRSYTALCEILGLDHLLEAAKATDIERRLDKPREKAPNKGKSNASALAAGGQLGRARQHQKRLAERKAGAQPRPGPEPASAAAA